MRGETQAVAVSGSAFHLQPNPNPGGTPDSAKLEVHPAAELFRLMEGVEFQKLVEDIRAKGLRTPILLDPDGRVPDGRNRLRASTAAPARTGGP